MKKAIFFILFFLAITLAMLFDLKNNGTEKAVSERNPIISPKKILSKIDSSEEYLKISFLDVGQGDAEFIEWPDGEQMLVDCAKDATVLGALGRVMEYYDREIDYLFITHPDLDHYGGCADVLKRFDIKNIVYTGLQKEDKSWQYFWDMIAQENAKYSEITKKDIWQIDNTTIDFLYPDKKLEQNSKEKDNNTSLVFKLSYGESDILFMGDAEIELENYLIGVYGEGLNTELLKVGHHGSGGSSCQNFINIVSPDFSVISVGKDNNYGHPSRRVLKRLERAGSKVYRTDKQGDIIVKVGKNGIILEE